MHLKKVLLTFLITVMIFAPYALGKEHPEIKGIRAECERINSQIDQYEIVEAWEFGLLYRGYYSNGSLKKLFVGGGEEGQYGYTEYYFYGPFPIFRFEEHTGVITEGTSQQRVYLSGNRVISALYKFAPNEPKRIPIEKVKNSTDTSVMNHIEEHTKSITREADSWIEKLKSLTQPEDNE